MSDAQIHKPPLPKILITVVLLVTVGLLFMGNEMIKKQKQSILRSRQTELNAITDIKADQVERWRKDRLNEAEIIQSNTAFIDLVDGYSKNRNAQISKEAILRWMVSYISHYDYSTVMLLDDQWKPLVSLPEDQVFEKAASRYGRERLVKEKKVVITELHKVEHINYAHFDLLIPLFSNKGNDFTGTLLFRIDPTRNLYPILNRWPGVSETGEAYLTRGYGDSSVYLSELKFYPDALLKKRKNLEGNSQTDTIYPHGYGGYIETKDYRNKLVLISAKNIPGTDWILYAKIDTSELLHSSAKELTLSKIILALIILIVLAMGGFLIWFHLVRYYKKMYEAETEKKALIKHFNYILKFANDFIFLLDEKLTVIEVNDKVIDFYGYTRKEITGMNASVLRSPKTLEQMEDQYKNLKNKGSLTFDVIHRKKNGTEFPVEISARLVKMEGKTYYQIIGRDITERKKEQEDLSNLVLKYNLALSAANLGVWEWDFIENRLTWDDTVSEIYGKNKNKITDSVNEWIDVVHPDDLVKAREEVRSAAAGLSDYCSEYRIIKPGGEIRFIRSTGRMLRDSHGIPARMTGVTQDITEYRIAFDLLKERDFWLRESQRAGRVGSFSLDLEADKWSTSEILDDILGLEADTSRNIESWNSIIHPDFQQNIRNYFINLKNSDNDTFEKEYKIIKQNSREVRWILARGEVHKDKDGSVVMLIGTVQDITERKNVEEELRESNKKINTIINNLKGVIFRCRNDKNWTMKFISEGISELAGYESDDFIENKVRSFTSIVYAPDRSRVANDIRKSLENDSTYTIEYRIATSTGAIKWVWERGRAAYDGPEINFIEGFITDITDRKHVEEELIRAKEKAEESDRLKTAFLHNISHEIRTPMNAIVGFTTLLDSPDLDNDSRRQYMDIIFQSSNQLLSIITDIVDISNIEVGHVKLSIGTVNINTLIKNLFDQFSLRAKQQGIELSYVNTLTDDTSFVLTDGTKLIQVLTNLINNALKFTPRGAIEFGYTLRDNDVEFFVKDSGIGIDNENFDKIFNRFYQIESSLSKQFSGTGLGLAISKAYIELMGGRIWLTSRPGKGTTFFFTIPHDNPETLNFTTKAVNTQSTMSKASGRTILVAEDDRINFLLIREILSKTGIVILWAANGEEAVEICRKNNEIDILLLDIKMPIMDGYEALKIIKTFRPTLPVVAITAYAQETDKEKAIAEGCVAHITKPIDRTQLFGVLQKYL